MKKRYLYILLALALLLTACAAKPEPETAAPPEEAAEQQPEPQPVPEPQPPEPQPIPEPQPPEPQPIPEPQPPEPQPVPEPQPPEPQPTPDPQPPEPQPIPTVSLSDVCASMVTAAGVTEPMYLDTDAFANLYGIDPSWVAQSAGFVTMSGVFPDEVAIFEAVDAGAAAQIAACLQTRLDEVMVQAETYDPDSYAKAQQCSVVTNGNYVRLLLSPKQAELAEAYGQYIQ